MEHIIIMDNTLNRYFFKMHKNSMGTEFAYIKWNERNIKMWQHKYTNIKVSESTAVNSASSALANIYERKQVKSP